MANEQGNTIADDYAAERQRIQQHRAEALDDIRRRYGKTEEKSAARLMFNAVPLDDERLCFHDKLAMIDELHDICIDANENRTNESPK